MADAALARCPQRARRLRDTFRAPEIDVRLEMEASDLTPPMVRAMGAPVLDEPPTVPAIPEAPPLLAASVVAGAVGYLLLRRSD